MSEQEYWELERLINDLDDRQVVEEDDRDDQDEEDDEDLD